MPRTISNHCPVGVGANNLSITQIQFITLIACWKKIRHVLFSFNLFYFRFDKMSEEIKEKGLTDQKEDNGIQQINQVYSYFEN